MIWMMATSMAATIDGSSVGDSYGPALAVQTVETQFGDNFSELNAAYGTIENDRLELLITGNIEANFNSLWIWLDTDAPGGQNPIELSVSGGGTNPDFGLGGPIFDSLAGMSFDPGFAPTHALWVQRGFNAIDGFNTFDVRVVELGTGNAGFGEFLNAFSGADFGSASNLPTAWNMDIAYNGSNAAGVLGGTGAANQAAALAVTTGLELSIPLASIGSPTNSVLAMAQVNNGDMNYLSNQSLGGLPAGTGNLGGDGAGTFTGNLSGVDYGAFAGDQFFRVAPAPLIDCDAVARPDVCERLNDAAYDLNAAEGAPVIDEGSPNVRLRPSTLYTRLAAFADAVDAEGSCALDGWVSGSYTRRDLVGSFSDEDAQWSFTGDLQADRRFTATTSSSEALAGRVSARTRKIAGTGDADTPFGGVFVRISGTRGVYVGLNTTCTAPSTVAQDWYGSEPL